RGTAKSKGCYENCPLPTRLLRFPFCHGCGLRRDFLLHLAVVRSPRESNPASDGSHSRRISPNASTPASEGPHSRKRGPRCKNGLQNLVDIPDYQPAVVAARD